MGFGLRPLGGTHALDATTGTSTTTAVVLTVGAFAPSTTAPVSLGRAQQNHQGPYRREAGQPESEDVMETGVRARRGHEAHGRRPRPPLCVVLK